VRPVIRECLLGFTRTPLLSALSVTTIAFSLFTLGLFGLVAVNLGRALSTLEDRVEIVAYLLRGTPIEAATLAAEDVAAFPEVAQVRYVSEDSALARAQAELNEFREAYRDLQTNPLPASLEVALDEGRRDPETVAAVADRLRGIGVVEDVRFGEEWVAGLARLRRIAGIVGLAIGLAFAGVALVIIGTTIRMALLQRSREITILRLVGATDGFIRAPYLLEGALKGLMGGILALLLTWVAFALVRGGASDVLVAPVFLPPVIIGGGILAGTLLGLLASAASVSRHLRPAAAWSGR
jgi:cell division transport system permease protein